MSHHYSLEEIVGILSSTLADMESRAIRESNLGELSMRQIYYLETISGMEQPTPSELARLLGVSKPSITAIVNKLVQKGYLKKVQSGEDRRSFFLVLPRLG